MTISGYPYFKRGLTETGQIAGTSAESIPTIDRQLSDKPGDYVPHPDLSHAVNVALVLGMPLLLTGEPGTGKTQLASTLAHDLNCAMHKFETKSTSSSRDLFYSYDALSAFKMKDAIDPRLFIRFQALGRAVLEAFSADHPDLQRLLPPKGSANYEHPGSPRRAVVLIDEIDKAPRDFPNDILNEIDRLHFRVPELMNAGSPGADSETSVPSHFRPIVVMTSNSEKGLPDPFLRRCIYFDIPFPDREQMNRIVAARIHSIDAGTQITRDAIDLFYRLRHDGGLLRLIKEPSTAELLNWIQLLLFRGAQRDMSLKAQPTLVLETSSALIKNSKDRNEALEFIRSQWLGGKSA